MCVCVQLTDDIKATTGSSPPAKRSRPADRRVTFNPNVQERALLPSNEPPKPVTLKEAADIVVRYLDPFYTQGKFATKVRERDEYRFHVCSKVCSVKMKFSAVVFFVLQELFKSFARFLSHLLAEGRSRGKGQGKQGIHYLNVCSAACDGLLPL